MLKTRTESSAPRSNSDGGARLLCIFGREDKPDPLKHCLRCAHGLFRIPQLMGILPCGVLFLNKQYVWLILGRIYTF